MKVTRNEDGRLECVTKPSYSASDHVVLVVSQLLPINPDEQTFAVSNRMSRTGPSTGIGRGSRRARPERPPTDRDLSIRRDTVSYGPRELHGCDAIRLPMDSFRASIGSRTTRRRISQPHFRGGRHESIKIDRSRISAQRDIRRPVVRQVLLAQKPSIDSRIARSSTSLAAHHWPITMTAD